MNLMRCSLSALSDLRYTYRNTEDGSVLIISFSGSYGVGSRGNNDGTFISAVTLAGLVAFGGGCLVLDFTEMDYSWGNTLLQVFNAVGQYLNEPGEAIYPVFVVTSDRCRAGFLSLIGKTEEAAEWHFRDLVTAIESAQVAARRWYDS